MIENILCVPHTVQTETLSKQYLICTEHKLNGILMLLSVCCMCQQGPFFFIIQLWKKLRDHCKMIIFSGFTGMSKMNIFVLFY